MVKGLIWIVSYRFILSVSFFFSFFFYIYSLFDTQSSQPFTLEIDKPRYCLKDSLVDVVYIYIFLLHGCMYIHRIHCF